MTQAAKLPIRLIAKVLDFALMALLLRLLGPWAGGITALAYLAFGDFAIQGQSLGKRLMGLRVINLDPNKPPTPISWQQSLIRNGGLVFLTLLSFLGLVGLILSILAGIIYVGFEIVFLVTDPVGTRIGDWYARTRVIEDQIQSVNLDV